MYTYDPDELLSIQELEFKIKHLTDSIRKCTSCHYTNRQKRVEKLQSVLKAKQ